MTDLKDERAFTQHAQPGWMSWDQWSPEQDFCRFVGMLQRMLQPSVTLETGVGIGRITNYLDAEIGEYLGFEADPRWRQPPADPEIGTPSAEQMAIAELVILDSEPDFRLPEVALWAKHGKPNSVCIVHDCGNGHPDAAFHAILGRTVQNLGHPGLMLRNPRGSWMGWHL